MTSAGTLALVASVLAISGACRAGPEAKAAQIRTLEAERQQDVARRIVQAGNNPAKPVAVWIMPPELREISGLALTPTNQVLAHDDEIARIYEIDPKGGIILKRFTLSGAPHGDFEAITIVDKDIYLLQSDGKLFKFREGTDGEQVTYSTYDTSLGHECEFEGLAFESDSSWLVMPCKKVSSKGPSDALVIYRVPLPLTDTPRFSTLFIPMAEVIGSNSWKNFQPSDIAIDPATGNYVLVASHEKALAVITPGGKVVRSEPLPPGHAQAEGVAVTRDGILIVSDEARSQPADMMLYRWQR